MTSGVYGFGNDNFGGFWLMEWLHDAAFSDAKTGFTHELRAPYGLEVDDRFIQPVDRFWGVLFGGIGDGIFAYNAQILLSFLFAGLTMYALARYLTAHRPAAALAGVIFAASPFHLAMATQYHSLASIQWIPLLVLAILVALRRRRLRDAAFVGAALAAVWASSYYYGFFAIWFLIVLLLVAGGRGLLNGLRARRTGAVIADGARFLATRGSVAALTFTVLVGPLLFSLVRKVASKPGEYSRSSDDFYYNSVEPWQLILPPHDNPIFGGLTSGVINSHLALTPVHESATYLGAVALGLTLLGLLTRRRVSPRSRFATPLLIAGGIFAVLLTFGPYIPRNPFSVGDWLAPRDNPHIKNVSYYLFEVSSAFRYYGRAFVYASVCLAALAAIGFATLDIPLRRRYGRYAPAGVAAFLTLLVVGEYNNNAPAHWVDLRKPPWVRAVEQLPAGTSIIDYPTAGFSTPRSLYYVFQQARHDHPTVNPPVGVPANNFRLSVGNPDDPAAGQGLHDKGIDYAVIHTKLPPPNFPPYQPVAPDDALPATSGARNPWFRLVRRTSDAVIYRVLDRPRFRFQGEIVNLGSGFHAPERDGDVTWAWTSGPTSTIFLTTGRSRRTYILAMAATSFAQQRTLDVRIDGRRVGRKQIPTGSLVDVAIPVVLDRGRHVAELTADPAPQSIGDVLKVPDPREVGLRVRTPTLTAAANGASAGFGAGFLTPENAAAGRWAWMTGSDAQLGVGTSRTRRYALRFGATSLGESRRLDVTFDGLRVKTITVPSGRVTPVTVRLRVARGEHTVGLHASPGARVIDEVLGNGDARKVSVRIRQPQLTALP